MAEKKPIAWNIVIAIVGGMTLLGWAVQDVLSWAQRAALVFGVVLLAYGFASGRQRH